MLPDNTAMATIAVKDIASAKKFYEGTLGLKPRASEEKDVLTYASGDSTMVVYKSDFAGTNKATSATWGVGKEFDSIVRQLQTKGVAFEHYDMPGMRRDGDVHTMGNFKAAWFKDPDGNILHINNETTH